MGFRLLTGDDGGPVAADRPGPVLLVPGYGGGTARLEVLAGRIRATGRTATVLTLPDDGTGDLGAQVAELARAAHAAIDAGAPSVDVVGYSAGGVVAGLWLARDDDARVRRVVSLGSPLHGAQLAGAGVALLPDACPTACRQLAPGSPVLDELVRRDVGARLPWLAVWTADDETVVPPGSATIDGAVSVELQAVCPDAVVAHGDLPTDPLVTGLVLRALRSTPLTAPTPADCTPLRTGT